MESFRHLFIKVHKVMAYNALGDYHQFPALLVDNVSDIDQ